MESVQQKQKIENQRERIRRFDEEMISYQSNGFPVKWGERLYGGIMLLMLFMPAEFLMEEKGMIFLILLWTAVMGPSLYLTPYLRIREQGKTVSYLRKIKYLPLDIKQVKYVRIGYLAKFLKKIVLIACIEQIVFGTFICGQNIFVGVLYAVVAGGIIPMLWNTAVIWVEQ